MTSTHIEPKRYTHAFFDTQAQSILDAIHPQTGLGLHSGRSLKQLSSDYQTTIEIMEWAAAKAASDRKHITPAKPSTADDFDWMLNVLPPCQWVRRGDIEHFFLSERISGNVVRYCVRMGNRYFKFQDLAGLTTEQIFERIRQADAAPATNPV